MMHLVELRSRLLRMVLCVLLVFAVLFFGLPVLFVQLRKHKAA